MPLLRLVLRHSIPRLNTPAGTSSMRSLRSRGVGSVAQPIELSDGSPSSSPVYPLLPAQAQRSAPAAAGAASKIYPALPASTPAARKRAEKRSLADALDEQADARPAKEPARSALRNKPAAVNASVWAGASAAAGPSAPDKSVSTMDAPKVGAAKAPSRPTSAASSRNYKSNTFKGAQRPRSNAYGYGSGSAASSKRDVMTEASARARKAAQTRKRNKELEDSRTKLEAGLAVYVLEKPVGVLPAPWNTRKPGLATTANREEAAELIACIPRGVPLSVDAEWRFDYKGGAQGQIALLQIAAPGMVLLLQLTQMKVLPDGLQDLLMDETGWKVGVNISNDGRKMFNDWGLCTAGLLELSTLAKMVDPVEWSGRNGLIALRDLVRVYLKRKLRKDATRTSNWELAKLSAEQIEYGACDVAAALEVGWLLMEKLDEKVAAEKAAAASDAASAEASGSKASESASPSTSASKQPAGKTKAGGPAMSTEARKLIKAALFGFSAGAAPAVQEAAATVVVEAAVSAFQAPVKAQASAKAQVPAKAAAPVKAAPVKVQAVKVQAVKGASAPAAKGGAQKSHERAFAMWLEGHDIDAVCAQMRTAADPLKLGTVSGYLIRAAEESGIFPPLPSSKHDDEASAENDAKLTELKRRMKMVVQLPEAKYGIRNHRPFLRQAGFLAKGEAKEGWSESSDSNSD